MSWRELRTSLDHPSDDLTTDKHFCDFILVLRVDMVVNYQPGTGQLSNSLSELMIARATRKWRLMVLSSGDNRPPGNCSSLIAAEEGFLSPAPSWHILTVQVIRTDPT